MASNDLQPGMKVRTVYGNWITVMRVNGTTVYYYEQTALTIHITKLQLSTAH